MVRTCQSVNPMNMLLGKTGTCQCNEKRNVGTFRTAAAFWHIPLISLNGFRYAWTLRALHLNYTCSSCFFSESALCKPSERSPQALTIFECPRLPNGHPFLEAPMRPYNAAPSQTGKCGDRTLQNFNRYSHHNNSSNKS